MREEIKPDVQAFVKAHGRPPGLGIVLVGEDPASHVYVRNKLKAAEDVGFYADCTRLSARRHARRRAGGGRAAEPERAARRHPGAVAAARRRWVPARRSSVFDAIAVGKDVDGFAAESIGLLVQNRPQLVACTPAGVIEMLEREKIQIAGKRAVVLGRSDIVGKPMALLLLHRDATVTICHSRTPDLAATCRQADILVAAVGRPGFVTPDFVKPGATVVDVGINEVRDAKVAATLFPEGHPRLAAFAAKGSVLVGDVHPSVDQVAGALTPVPRGVGPLTITMLMKNTLKAALAGKQVGR